MILLLCLVLVLLAVVVDCFYVKEGYSDNYLSPQTTQIEKGFAALLIVMHHISQLIKVPIAVVMLRYIGFIMVAIFFFISGYGLMYGLIHKENYMNNFWKKRILRIYTPYWIVVLLAVILNLISGVKYSIRDIVLSFAGCDFITKTWFVTSIIVIYVLFYLSFRFIKKDSLRLGKSILVVLCLIYCIVSYVCGLGPEWSASILAFLLGIFWSEIKTKFITWIRKNYWVKLITIFVLFAIFFCGRLVLGWLGWNNDFMNICLRNIVSAVFVLFIIAFTQKIEFKKRKVYWIGSISFEIYIVHYVLLEFFRKYISNDSIYAVIVIGATIGISALIQYISKCVRRIEK